MTSEKKELARAVYVAKMAYWDALRALEKATAANGEEWDDRTNDDVHTYIEGVCAGCDQAEDLHDEDLEGLLELASRKPK